MQEIEKLVRQSKAYAKIKHEKNVDKLSHAYLFVSSDTEYLAEFARAIAKLIMCQSDDICSVCSSCCKNDAGVHADVMKFKSSDINPLVVSEFISSISIMPYEGNYKIYIFEDVGEYSQIIQNKLLKSIEEPPASVIILLTTNNENKVISTIKSRASRVALDAFSLSQLMPYLKKYSSDEKIIEMAVASSQGLPCQSMKTLADVKFKTLYDTVFNVFSNMNSSSDILKFASLFTDKNEIQEFVSLAEIIVRDLIVISAGEEELMLCKSSKKELIEISKGFTISGLSTIIDEINNALRKIFYGVSPVTIMDSLLFKIVEVKVKCKK
ncbi:MAG: hypothetical protein RR334_03005 [Clostridia bacterium]